MMPAGDLGYFEIGIYQPCRMENIGTLWRSAWQLGAAGIFTIGKIQRRQGSDVLHTEYRIPYRMYETLEDFFAARPQGAEIIGIEMGGIPLRTFVHPKCAVYLLGSEANGLSKSALALCSQVVEIESIHYPSYNVAVSGSIVMYHRFASMLK